MEPVDDDEAEALLLPLDDLLSASLLEPLESVDLESALLPEELPDEPPDVLLWLSEPPDELDDELPVPESPEALGELEVEAELVDSALEEAEVELFDALEELPDPDPEDPFPELPDFESPDPLAAFESSADPLESPPDLLLPDLSEESVPALFSGGGAGGFGGSRFSVKPSVGNARPYRSWSSG